MRLFLLESSFFGIIKDTILPKINKSNIQTIRIYFDLKGHLVSNL